METKIARVTDLETTAFPPDAVVCEAAYVDVELTRADAGEEWAVAAPESWVTKESLFDIGEHEMSIEALSVHHITKDACRGAPHHSLAADFVREGRPALYVAHNAEFEKQFIPTGEGEWWIDTYKVALRLFQDFSKHNNQYLRYALGVQLDPERAQPPHRALPDAYVTAHLFAHMVTLAPVRDMIRWSMEPPYITKVTFGKHIGMKWDEVPASYARWCLAQDMDAGVLEACRRRLAIGD